MWSFSNAINFLFSSIKKFPKIINGINAYSKDTVSEIGELFSHSEEINMNGGIEDILYGTSLAWWGSAFVSIITGILSGILGLVSSVIGVSLGMLITSFILLIMYNHKDAWSPLITKIYCVLVILNIIFSAIGILTNSLSFSLVGIVSAVGKVISVLGYSLVLRGLLE